MEAYNQGVRRPKMDEDQDYALMKELNFAKFSQNSYLKSKLKATGNLFLIEHTRRDILWGDGGQRNFGKNWLGKILMEVRDLISTP